MAARYWVGGTGNWNDSTHWSATSGGVGGATVPTSDDDVYFDSNSGTGTVTVNTIANMRDCTFAQTQLITLANAAYAFNIFGNWTLCSNNYLATSFTGTGYVYLKATTSVNITSNGSIRAWNRLYFDGVGGVFNFIDGFQINGLIGIINGVINTNDNNITNDYIFAIYGNATLNYGNSTITCNYYRAESNHTINAGTSTIKTRTYFWGKGLNYFNVEFINSRPSTASIRDNNIFENIIINTNIGPDYKDSGFTFEGNQIINNSLTINASSNPIYRPIIMSSVIGTPRTITCNGTVTASNVDFRDIVGAGTANWDLSNIAGGSGDCGGNSGITFTPAQTQYFKNRGGLEKIPNLIDREFLLDTGWWSKGAGWSIVDGVMRGNLINGTSFEKPAYFITGKSYKIKFTLSNYKQGYCFAFAGNNISSNLTSNGTYEFELTASNPYIGIRAYSNFIGDIENISILQSDLCEWADSLNWFSDLSPRTTVGRIPLPQDDAIFDENSFTGASTLNVNVPIIGNVYTSAITNIVNIVFSITTTIYGNSILNGFNSLSATYLYIIGGRTEYCGVNLPLNHSILILYIYSLKIELLCNISANTIRISDGGMCSFKSNDFKMNAFGAGYIYFYPGFNATDSFLDLGSSLIGIENVTTGNPFVMVHSNIPRSRINMNNATFFIRSNDAVDFRNNTEIAGITSSKKIIIDTPNAISSVKILNVPPIQFATDELEVTAGSRVKFSELSGFNINKLTAIGTPEQPITIGSTTPGSKYTLNITGTEPIETDYINITDCNITQTNKFYAGVNSINGGNNTNVIFDYAELPLNMNLYTLKMYDKVLTDDEVLQNYNTTKSRYII